MKIFIPVFNLVLFLSGCATTSKNSSKAPPDSSNLPKKALDCSVIQRSDQQPKDSYVVGFSGPVISKADELSPEGVIPPPRLQIRQDSGKIFLDYCPGFSSFGVVGLSYSKKLENINDRFISMFGIPANAGMQTGT
jgi:hypothetical protein